jgi:hypothetical protein
MGMQGRKAFFFEKKKQKTFAERAELVRAGSALSIQVFGFF